MSQPSNGQNLQIVLVRHGKPQRNNAKIRASQMQDWVQQYNSAALASETNPPAALMEIARHSEFIISSDLKRSRQSAQMLGDTVDQGHAIYREIDLPHLRFPSPRLSPATWVAVFRLLWLLGVSLQCESFRGAKKRAQFAANQLEQAAQQHHTVILVGHGLFNRFIAKALVKQNWHGTSHSGSRYWDYVVLKKMR